MDTVTMTHKSYISVDANNIITKIFSDVFEPPTSTDIEIGEGTGEEFVRPQNDYQLIDSDGNYNYKYEYATIVKRSDEEKQLDASFITLVRISKTTEIKSACAFQIVSGIDFDALGTGTKLHYTLEQTKQDDMKILMTSISDGANAVLWHDSSRVMHEVYTAEQFTKLYKAVMNFIVGCKIHSDGLEQYLRDTLDGTDSDKIAVARAINWDTVLPDSIQSIVDQQIAVMKQ